MIDENIQLLKLLNPTSNSLFQTKRSINSRMDNFDDLNELGRRFIQKEVINNLDDSIAALGRNINRLLNNIPIYIDFLRHISVLTIYDCSVLLIELKDIKRYPKFQNLLSYSGYSPKKGGNQNLYKCLLKIGNKLKKDPTYSTMYELYFEEYQQKYPDWDTSQLDNAAIRKLVKLFLKNIYRIWNFQELDR